ncbi:MAG: methyltransferase domain-containing protein [Solirubrobacteraceae bacterium]
MKVGMLTSWNTQCGIAEYSRALVEALASHDEIELVVLGSRNYDERALAPDEDYVVACFDVAHWNRYGHDELDVERILALGLDVLHVQFQLGLYNLPRLLELLERFEGASVITWHDNWVPRELELHRFDAAITHRLGVGPTDNVISFGVRNVPAIVRTFGLGRTREEIIAPICERNGWTFESAASSEAPYGGQRWVPWRELHDWLRGADAIVLWYAENELVGSSQAAHTALATRRPLVVTDTTWFADLPARPGRIHKIADDPAALEATLHELLDDPLIAAADWQLVAARHLDCYQRAISDPAAAPGVRQPNVASPPPPPLSPSEQPAAQTLAAWLAGDAGHLHRAFDLTAVPVSSRRRLSGRAVVALKRALRRLLFPLLDVQSSVNAANARVVTFLLEQAEAQSRAIEALGNPVEREADPPDGVAIPSQALIRRTGWTPGTDVVGRYLTDGRSMAALLESLLERLQPSAGRPRVLDFGCGVGKVSRHLASLAERAELFGCDIDGASIDWMTEHHTYGSFVRVAETPGLPWDDGFFDLIYAVSVFTHLTDGWAGWLLELHRVLAAGGLAVVTVLGEGMVGVERGGEWDADAIGMNVLRHGQDWEGGGPTVFHSPWWISEHWGRAFELVEIRQERGGDGRAVRGVHDIVIMRRREVVVSVEELERIDPAEPREMRALVHNIAQLHADDAHLRRLLAEATARGDAEHDHRVALSRQLDASSAELAQLRAAANSLQTS